MPNMLLDYYFTLLEVLVILLLFSAVGIAVYWGMGRRWQSRLKVLEQKHAADLTKHDSEHFQALHNHLQSAIAHEFLKHLPNISKKSEETLEGLGKEQTVLREKQKRIIAKACELDQHAENIVNLFDPEGNGLKAEFLNIRRLIEHVVLTVLLLYADSKGVTLMADLDDVEPTVLDRNKTLVALSNVIHNAIKYSLPGGVVKIVLSLEIGETKAAEKTICVEVTDTGKGIREEDQEGIFELWTRGNGLIEPGSGLGLYLARKAARRQGGDVLLVHSRLNQGSVFRIVLPYRAV
jgi:signal transduction histidine kinase